MIRRLSETFGVACGVIMAPFFAATSFLRRSRTFHPRGDLYIAHVSNEGASNEYAELAARLSGPAIVRFSGALWKHAEVLDVLGCALRFQDDDTTRTKRLPRDQDLLLATIRRPWTMPVAPFLTDAHDYLGNEYFAVSPFQVEGVGRVSFRLRPQRASRETGRRRRRLSEAVASESARLHLEGGRGPWGPWQPIVRIDLTKSVDMDDAALRFDPFADGRGIRPIGFVHSLRRGVYAMSQLARPNRQR